MGLRITLAGDQGSGKGTVSKILVERTGAKYFSTGNFAREKAKQMGMDIKAFSIYAESHPEIDYEIDGELEKLNDLTEDMVIDSRMAWHFVRNSFKVYMFCDPVESARRIMNAGRDSESFRSLEDAIAGVDIRRQSEIKRYRELYSVNIKDPDNYSLFVDTTYASPEQVAECILGALERYRAYPQLKAGYICPGHLLYPDRPMVENMLTAFTTTIEMGSSNVPPVSVCERDSRFYITDSPESAVVFGRMGLVHVPFIRQGEYDPNTNYITAENILCKN